MPKKSATPPTAAPAEPIPAAPARRAKKGAAAATPTAPAAAKAATKPAARAKLAKPVPAPPPRKTTADFLREALAAKKASNGVGSPKLRPDMGNAKASKDAERRFGKSRKVH